MVGLRLPWALWEPVAIALTAHVGLFTVGYFAFLMVPETSWVRMGPPRSDPFWGSWLSWDASWYAKIALRGYTAQGPDAPTVAFWPLLPILEGVIVRPLLALGLPRMVALAWTALAINTVASVAASVLLYRLLGSALGAQSARRGVLLLCFAPAAIFMVAGYAEPLLLVGVFGFFLALLHRRWALAGVAGAWAAAAHVPGILLTVPYLWAFLRAERGWRISLLWGALIPVPVLLWLGYLGLMVNDPLAPIHAAGQEWQHVYQWPWTTVIDGVQRMTSGSPYRRPLYILNLLSTAAMLAAAVWSLRIGRPEWGVWALLLVVLYLAVPASVPVDGMMRYMLPAVPVWGLLSRAPISDALLVGVSSLVAGLLTALYVNSYWVA